MADRLARAVAHLVALCPFVQSVHDLATKQRVIPHHFHREDGAVVSSPLAGNPKQDIEHVVADLNKFLDSRL